MNLDRKQLTEAADALREGYTTDELHRIARMITTPTEEDDMTPADSIEILTAGVLLLAGAVAVIGAARVCRRLTRSDAPQDRAHRGERW